MLFFIFRVLFIFVIIFLFSICRSEIVRIKRGSRTVAPETVDFQLIYLGTCDQFFNIPKISISSQLGSCLPINETAPFLDRDDLSAHVLCTNIGKNRAQIDFLEIYSVYGTPLTTGFIISFSSNAPFRSSSFGVTYMRRPSCETKKDFCSTKNYVDSCTNNNVAFKKSFVISKDIVYIIPKASIVFSCQTDIDTCCGFLTAGYCPFKSDNSVMKIKFRKHHSKHEEEDDYREEDNESQKTNKNSSKKQPLEKKPHTIQTPNSEIVPHHPQTPHQDTFEDNPAEQTTVMPIEHQKEIKPHSSQKPHSEKTPHHSQVSEDNETKEQKIEHKQLGKTKKKGKKLSEKIKIKHQKNKEKNKEKHLKNKEKHQKNKEKHQKNKGNNQKNKEKHQKIKETIKKTKIIRK